MASALLTGCGGGGGTPSGGGFSIKNGYEFNKVDYVIQESFKQTVEAYYSKSYIEFTMLNYSYRFSYIVTQGSYTLYYDDLGYYKYQNNVLETTFSFSLYEGMRTTSTQSAYFVDFTNVGNQVIGSMHTNDSTKMVVAKFSMNPVSKRVPSYASNYTHIVSNYDNANSELTKENVVDIFRGSKARLDGNKFYFTYLDMFTIGQRCVVKEEGIISDEVDPLDPECKLLTITKRTKYHHDEFVSEEDGESLATYQIYVNDTDLNTKHIFLVKRDDYRGWQINYDTESYLAGVLRPDFPL